MPTSGPQSARARRIAAVMFSILLHADASAQNPVGDRLQAIRAALSQRDPATALAHADSLAARLPGHQTPVYLRAVALASAGRDAEAAAAVRTLLRWDPRMAHRVLQDTALARLRALLGEVHLDSLVEHASHPIARGHVWAVLEERDLVGEGTAWDPATQRFLVGSMNKYKVVAVAPDGSARDLVPAGAHGLRSVIGIHVDAARGILWVTSLPRYDDPSDTTSAALYAFDAATGAFQRRIPGPPDESFLNDLTTGADGAVYLTDSRGARVLVLRPGADSLERFDAVGPLAAPNGITISADGRLLFVADMDHVRVVALADGRQWRIEAPDSVSMSGIDGLAFASGSLIAHHPLAYWRVVRYVLDSALRGVVRVERIEWNTPDARTSTTGDVAGDSYYYLGNGQLDRMNAGTIDSAAMNPIRLYRAPIRQAASGVLAVALRGVDSVALFDPHTLEPIATLPTGSGPHEIAPAADGKTLYVADATDSSITVLGVADAPRVAATWRLPNGLRVHDVSPDATGTVWAVSGDPSVLVGLDASTGAVRHRQALGRPGSWMLDANGPAGSLIIANLEGGAVSLVQPSSGRETVIEGQPGEIDALLAPNGTEIWSVNAQTGHLSVFDARTGALLTRVASGAGASRIVFTPDGRTALVVHAGDSTLVAYDVARRAPTDTAVLPAGPKVLALSRDGRRAYVTHPRGLLTMIDVPSLTVLRSIPLGGTPDGVALAEPR